MLHSVPPGYRDSDKDDGGIGDIDIWHAMLAAGKAMGKNVVFVGGDEKNDWTVRSNAKALFPRSELIDEFYRITKHQFGMMNVASFLKDQGAATETVLEIESSLVPVPEEYPESMKPPAGLFRALRKLRSHMLSFLQGHRLTNTIMEPEAFPVVIKELEYLLGEKEHISLADSAFAVAAVGLLYRIEKLNDKFDARIDTGTPEDSSNLESLILQFLSWTQFVDDLR